MKFSAIDLPILQGSRFNRFEMTFQISYGRSEKRLDYRWQMNLIPVAHCLILDVLECNFKPTLFSTKFFTCFQMDAQRSPNTFSESFSNGLHMHDMYTTSVMQNRHHPMGSIQD